jgi:hypothetical protein
MDGKKCEINSLKLLSYEKNQKVHKEKKKKETTKWIPQHSLTTRKQPKNSTKQTRNIKATKICHL